MSAPSGPEFREPAAAIRARAREVVGSLFVEPRQQRAMIDRLSRPGYALHPAAECRAGRLAHDVYCAIVGSFDHLAVDLGTAVELHMEAACFFDDVADAPGGAPQEDHVDKGELLALAIALLACSNALASRVACRAAGQAGGAALVELHCNCLTASGGQFLDVHFEGRPEISPDEAVDMTCRKSGTLGRSSAGFGARLVTDDAGLIRRFESLGHDLFTYAQVIDDLRDACPVEGPMCDYDRRKKTVPLNFFYRHQRTRPAPTDDDRIDAGANFRRDYEASGAALYGAMVAEVFLNRAKGTIQELKALGFPMERLEAMVARLEGGATDAVVTARLAEQAPR